ncbi:MAG TPA: HD-GYP domain-containing protein [Gaiellaceae bacterium]|nr:HD-GYP domain-containing protein [Gaiellaceae bacterium]
MRRRGWERSLTLLHVFLFASAAILVAGGALLGWSLQRTLQSEALDGARSKLLLYVDGVARPTLVKDGRLVVTRWGDQAIRNAFRLDPDIVSVKVWRADGTLVWTNLAPQRIGRRFAVDEDLATALRGQTSAGVVNANSDGENAVESKLGFARLFQVYAPLTAGAARRPIGAYEIYANPAAVDSLIGSRRRMIWTALGVVFLALWGALALLVRGASRLLQRQNEELRAYSASLEESALEAVETLNATVDAKDPYTAGHSQRVQRIALALGAELGLDAEKLDALRFAGLFHDIGKLGVPDAILTKPDRLTDDEYELIKRHPDDGARIVGRLHRLHDAVPAIRHHHERWDGRGYPGGLAGDEIPVEAAVVGLADAWDAMTTDRPYSPARPLEDAAEEIRRNRGTQFAPAVVDAFVRVLHRAPDVLAPDEPLVEALAL